MASLLTYSNNTGTKRKRESTRIKRQIPNEMINLFKQATNNPESVFLTIHGDPLKGNNHADIIKKVPDNIILVIITRPNNVIFTNHAADTETWRFFCQKLWAMAEAHNSTGQPSETCHFADYIRDIDDINITLPIEAADDDGVSSGETKQATINSLGEILANCQVFFPGDQFYNQRVTYDAEAKDFDAWNLVPVNNYAATEADEVLPRPLTLEDHDDNERTNVPKPNIFTRRATSRANFATTWNEDNQYNTTEKLLNIISDNSKNNKPKIVVLNSCSPSAGEEMTSENRTAKSNRINTKYTNAVKKMLFHLEKRTEIYLLGRHRFCSIRKGLFETETPPTGVKLPQYKETDQISRMQLPDRQELYIITDYILKLPTSINVLNQATNELSFHPLLFYAYANFEIDWRGGVMKEFVKKVKTAINKINEPKTPEQPEQPELTYEMFKGQFIPQYNKWKQQTINNIIENRISSQIQLPAQQAQHVPQPGPYRCGDRRGAAGR